MRPVKGLALLLSLATSAIALAQSPVFGMGSAASSSYSQGGAGAVSRVVSSKLQERVSVLDFGADPTGTLDSTAAFVAAVAALPSGAVLYLPHGTYRINPTSSLSPVSGTIIQGEGPYATTVLYTGTGAAPVWLVNSYVNGTGGQGQFLKFENFTMNGNSAPGLSCFSVGTPNTSTAKVQNVTFNNMRVTGCGSAGIQVNDVWDLNVVYSDIGYNGGDGITITDPDAVTGLYIYGTRIHNNGGHDINNTGAGTVTQLEQFGGEDTYSAGGAEVVLGNCRDCDFYGVWFEEAGAATAQNAIDATNAVQVHIDNAHSNFANSVVYASTPVSYLTLSNSSVTNAQAKIVNVPDGSTNIDFGQNNRSNVGVSVGNATAQNTISCPNAIALALTTSAGLSVNGCSGSNVVAFGSNGTLEGYISNVGNFYLKGGFTSISGSAYGQVALGGSSTGPTTTRNTADAVTASTDNQANAGSSGNIHDFQAQGVNQDGFTVQGVPYYRVGSAVASAATITPTSPSFHITGTVTVSTITPPTNCTSAANASGCALHVIPDAATPFATGGNIAAATTGVVGKLLTFIYDPSQSKWYPSY